MTKQASKEDITREIAQQALREGGALITIRIVTCGQELVSNRLVPHDELTSSVSTKTYIIQNAVKWMAEGINLDGATPNVGDTACQM